ncbi:MAG: molybdopterin-dependent oxidoreductase [Coriobacteriales bacterium]|jgi:anaerobic selenocysteine-containing dehydrogenase|nr:molybdopterin-dependent oxidoreductase [Coriobacteriales bacterium]
MSAVETTGVHDDLLQDSNLAIKNPSQHKVGSGPRDDLQPSTFTRPWQWQEDDYTVSRTTVWTAPGCHEGCGVLVYSKDGQVVKIEGDAENPYNRGRLCPRCFTITDVMYHKDRIIYPMRRDRDKRGDATAWKRISWEEALRICYDEMKRIADTYGPDTIHFQRGTGRDIPWQVGRLAYSVGSPNEYGCLSGTSCYLPRLSQCMMTIGGEIVSDFAQWLAKGIDDPTFVNPYCSIVWGCDPLVSNPDNKMGLWLTDCMKRGTKVITVDPRVTWIASRSEIHLQLRPGTDGALAMGMVNVLISEDIYDREFVDCWCAGFDELAGRVAEWTPERAAQVCWIDAEDIRDAARLFAAQKPANVFWGVSVDMQKSGTGAAQGIEALCAITGNIDIPGSMCFMDQPFGIMQGNGGWGLEFVAPEVYEHKCGIQEYPMYRYGLPLAQPDKALEDAEAGHCKAIWVQSTNPLACMGQEVPRWTKVFKDTEFCAAVDLFMTPTIQVAADIFLPVSCWPERNSTRAYYDLCTVNAVVEPCGEAKSDAEIDRLMGRMFREEAWPWENEEAILDEILEPSGFSFKQLRERGPIYEKYVYRKYEKGLLRQDGALGFETPSGRIELYSSLFEQYGIDPLPNYEEPGLSPVSAPELYEEYPIIMMSGARSPVSFHSENRQLAYLRQFIDDPLVDLHPDTARELGVKDGDWVWIENPKGRCRQRVQTTRGIRPKMALARHGWWYPEKDGSEPVLYGMNAVNVNNLLSNSPSPTGFGSDIKCSLCKIYKCTDEEVD